MTAVSSDGSTTGKTFKSSATGVATITNAGVVTPVSAGTAQITATINGVDSAPVTLTVTPTITAKTTGLSGKVGGSTVPFVDMFTVVGGTPASGFDFVVTPTAAGSVAPTTGVLTIANAPAAAFTVKATLKGNTAVTATASFTGTTPKLTSMTATAGTGGTLASGTLTIADHTTPAAGVELTIAGVPTGAVLGTLTTAKAGTDAGKVTATVSGNKVTILASDAIASSDTVVTITSSAGGTPLAITVKATA